MNSEQPISSTRIPTKRTFSIAIIVLTYKRYEDLLRCISSLDHSLSRSSLFKPEILIYNNDPLVPIEASSFGQCASTLIITNRPENIGARKNFCDSLADSFSRQYDYYLYISDDDYVLPDYFLSLEKYVSSSPDAIISSLTSLFFGHLNKTSYSKKSHGYRIVPTRPISSEKKRLQFIIDSRVLSGTMYSHKLLKKAFSFVNSDSRSQKFFYELWYPMCFLAAFSENPVFVPEPYIVHTVDNATYWEDHDFFPEFILGRIFMFRRMHECNLIDKDEYNRLLVDYISHQRFKNFLKLMLHPNISLKLLPQIIIKRLLVVLVHRPAIFSLGLARFFHYQERKLFRF